MNKIAKLPSRITIKNNHVPQMQQPHIPHPQVSGQNNHTTFYNWKINGSTDYNYNIDVGIKAPQYNKIIG